MKTLLSLVLACLAVLNSRGQCNSFYPMRANEKVTYEITNRNEKIILRTNQWFRSVKHSDNSAQGVMIQQMIDPVTSKVVNTSETVWTCNNGVLEFTVNNHSPFGNEKTRENGALTEMSGDRMDLPPSLEVGQTLRDLSYQVRTTSGGMILVNRNFQIRDRKVEARETVNTPAGTFECFRLSYNTLTKGRRNKGTTRTVSWYATGVGMVRSVTYNSRGEIDTIQLLTRVAPVNN